MTIQLVADGMRLAEPDGSWRLDLPVTAGAPYPTATIDLVPDAPGPAGAASSVRAMYSVEAIRSGSPSGRWPSCALPELDMPPRPRSPAPGVDLALPAGQVAPDLTVRIERADPRSGGRLLIQLLAADPSSTSRTPRCASISEPNPARPAQIER